MPTDKTNIHWNYSGKADFLLGTGATIAEQVLGWVASLMGAGVYGYLYLIHAFDWTGWQYLLAGILAFDVIGGIVANSLNSCKRLYHSAVKPDEPRYANFLKNHFAFSSLHVHSLLVALFFGLNNFFYGFFWYVFLMIGTIVVIKTPLYLRRPIAFLIIALALLLNIYFVLPVRGFEWLAPALFIKIIYGHLVQEEPYRPLTEKSVA